MRSLKQLLRLVHIHFILTKYGLDQFIVSIRLFTALRFVIYLNPIRWFSKKSTLSRGEAIRKTLEELGPIFTKFGQALSTRPDILPEDIASELCKLQDKVPPFASERVLHILEATFGVSAFELFAYFDPCPLASASIAQVHAATLKSGEDVVVKVLRPNMRSIIDNDISILKTIANLADRYWAESKRFKPKEIVQEFEHNLIDELDLQREAANASQLRRNFQHSTILYVPEIHWDYVRKNVLVMERIYGIPVSNIERLKECKINIKKLAERGLEIFFTQVFRDCFFHADMHPGNIFVSMDTPDDPQYICVDFGIMGTLSETDKRYLALNLLAFFNRDYRRVAELHIESGWVARDTRVAEFECAIRTVCEPVFERPLKDISFALVVLHLFQVARRFHMEVQPQLVLLQKTLLAIEGLGRQLYPELDLWSTAKPFLEQWLKNQIGPKALLHHLRENIPFFVEQLPYMPRLINDILVLTKDQKTEKQSLELPSNKSNQLSWYKGFGLGIFLVMSVFGGLSYFKLIHQQGLITMSISVAILGGVITLMSRIRRS